MILACVLLSGSPAGFARAGDAASAASIIPAEVDLFVAVDDAAKWRRGPGGALLEKAAVGLAEAGDLANAWAALSAALDMPGEQAFDELLGRRVVFARRNAPDAGQPSPWIMVSLVSAETEARLREMLKPAPRRVEKGLVILSLEDGRFRLAVASGKAASTVMLAPADAPALFDEMLATLGRSAERSLAGSKLGDDLRTIQRGAAALLLAKRRDKEGRLAIVGVGAKPAPNSIELALLLRSTVVAEQIEAASTGTRAAYNALAHDAIFAAVEWNIPDLPATLGLETPGFSLPAFFKNFDGRAWIGPGRAYRLAATETGGFELAAAIETTDTAPLAVSGDRMIASMLQGLWPENPDSPIDPAVLDFGGAFPDAVRSLNLAGSAIGAPMAAWLGTQTLAWVYAARDDAPPPPAPAPGWWIIGIGDAAVDRLRTALLAPLPVDEPPEAWLSVGIVRPALLAEALHKIDAALPPPIADILADARAIESAEWTLKKGDRASIRGEATVRFIRP